MLSYCWSLTYCCEDAPLVIPAFLSLTQYWCPPGLIYGRPPLVEGELYHGCYSNSGENHTLSIGSVPLTYMCGSVSPQVVWVASWSPMLNKYFARPPLRTCSFLSIKIRRQSPCHCHTCSCAMKLTMNRHNGDNPIPLFWIYHICCW